MSTPNVIYQFTCSTCPVQYIGMTERRLGDRVREHLPLWLSHCTDKTSRSSITDHIIEHGHTCKADDCFKILYRARNRRLLRFVEAVAIKRNKPRLNVMKETDLRLQLPWSWTTTLFSYCPSSLQSTPFPFSCTLLSVTLFSHVIFTHKPLYNQLLCTLARLFWLSTWNLLITSCHFDIDLDIWLDWPSLQPFYVFC